MKRSTGLAIAAYVFWGLVPIFWRQLESVGTPDLLGWRVCAGLLVMALVWAFRRTNPFAGFTWRHAQFGLVSAGLIGVNWAAFLWSVSVGQVVEASLGYFLMPIVSIGLGVLFLRERPNPVQLAAIAFATVGLAQIFVVFGSVPWVSLILAVSFGAYGMVRKLSPLAALEGLTVELAVLAPVGALFLGLRANGQTDVVGDGAPETLLLLAGSGIVTVVPLLLFVAAARSVSLTLLGLLAYLNPVLQFLVGWQVFGESVSAGKLVGFVWIWIALAVVVAEQVRSHRHGAVTLRPPEAAKVG